MTQVRPRRPERRGAPVHGTSPGERRRVQPIWTEARNSSMSASCSGVVPGSDSSWITSRVPSTSRIHWRFCCSGTQAQILSLELLRSRERQWPRPQEELVGNTLGLVVVGQGEVDSLAGVPIDGDVDRCRGGEAGELAPHGGEVVDGRPEWRILQSPPAPIDVDVADGPPGHHGVWRVHVCPCRQATSHRARCS